MTDSFGPAFEPTSQEIENLRQTVAVCQAEISRLQGLLRAANRQQKQAFAAARTIAEDAAALAEMIQP